MSKVVVVEGQSGAAMPGTDSPEQTVPGVDSPEQTVPGVEVPDDCPMFDV